MINHVLLELFCLKSRDDKTKECNLDCPAYECLVKKCPYCSFTSHENALCYVDNLANASHIISLGGEMLPDTINKQKAEELWEGISTRAIDSAYEEYMKEISK